MKYFFFLFFFILFLSCGIKQPVEREPEQHYGQIVVLSTPDGAVIFLDGQNTGKTTPDTLRQIPIGRHTIRTFLDEHKVFPDSILIQVKANAVHSASFSLQKLQRIGAVVVTSIPAGADILINDQPSGSITPDTLQLDADTYTISVQKNGYERFSQSVNIQVDAVSHLDADLAVQKCILVEAFGNVSCTPCVESAHNLETFVQNKTAGSYAIIEYFANWPSPNDPFYKEAPDAVKQRLMAYQLTSLPSMFISGRGVDAMQYNDIDLTFENARNAWDSPLGLSISKRFTDDTLFVRVETHPRVDGVGVSNLRLFVAIIENDIHFDAPPGSNGLTDFDFVFRGFLSDSAGDILKNSTQSFSYARTWRHWNANNSRIIAFVQDSGTKQIFHTAIN